MKQQKNKLNPTFSNDLQIPSTLNEDTTIKST